MARAVARRVSGYQHEVEIDGRHKLIVDEPESSGGTDKGPSPTRMVGAALASCTAITVEMYADRKGWDVGELRVDVDVDYEDSVPSAFTVTLHLPSALSEEQLDRLLAIAGRCPVHRILAAETKVSITDHVEPL